MKSIFILILFLIINITSSFAQTPLAKKFITIADIHFNPFIGCEQFSNPCPIIDELRTTAPQSWDTVFQKYSNKITTNYGQDTDYLLLTSTLTELNTLNKQQMPTFILLLGDFLAHHFPEQYKKYSGDESVTGYQNFVKKVFQYLTYKLNQAAPTTTIYPVLGNNDSYTGDYGINPNGLFLNNITTIFSTLIKNKIEQEEFQNTFPTGGYYTVTMTQKNQRLIILNSMFFSEKKATFAKQKAADEQLLWLEEQLKTAKQQQQSVLLALHIPPGVDIHLDLKTRHSMLSSLSPSLFLQSTNNKKLLSLLQRYSTTIVGILPAHIHADTFQLIANEAHSFIPSSFTPSISPVYGNNPGLKIFSYDDQTFQLINFVMYFYPLNEKKPIAWKEEYNFNAIYQPDCKQCLLVNGMLQLKKENALVDSYKKYYAVGQNTQPITTENTWMPYYWCGIYNTDWEPYKTCITNASSKQQ